MLKVLELGHIVTGPTAGIILSDLGHEVIKIEKPHEGDIARRFTHQSAGAFPFYNRNKMSLTLDLKQDAGRDIFMKLAKKADVVIDNMGHGSMGRLGLSFEDLARVNPGIIYLSLKGYAKGLFESRKSLDYPIEVHSGLAYMTGLTGRPMRVGGSLVDMGAAMFGVIGILDAILERERTGKGKFVDIGLFETAVFFMGQHMATYQITGQDLRPINETGFAWAIYDFFETMDGLDLFIAVTTDPQWQKFCKGISLAVCDDPNLMKNEDRFDRRDALIPLIRNRVKQMNSRDLVALLTELNVAYAVLNKPSDILEDPHEKEKLVEENYGGKKIRVPPTPVRHRYTADPPALGSDTDNILKELGYSSSEIATFRRNNII